MKYNWQQKDWPNFHYNMGDLQDLLFECTGKLNLHAGSLKNSPEDIKLETIIHFMVAEAITSSAIEGEIINEEEIKSSIKNHLGLNPKPKFIKDPRAEGISKIMIDTYNTLLEPLSKKKLNEWHSMLFFNQSEILGIKIGQYREHKEAMQVISGAIGSFKIHFEAPPSEKIDKEMNSFVKWFNKTAPGAELEIKAAPLRAAIAHLYFESIHPYEDGNGRIGRAIAEKALGQSIGHPILLSLSQEIEANKKLYYSSIETAQKSNEITAWIKYFTNIILQSSQRAEIQVAFIVEKSKFYENIKNQINSRQNKIINRMLKEGYKGFQGGISARKYQNICKCSKATATRDLRDLLDKKIIRQRQESGGGRSTSYDLSLSIRY